MNLYIFNKTSRAAVYGIGTYIRELSAALKGSAINVYVVHLMFDKPDMEMVETDNVWHWFIPSPINRNTSLDRIQQSELYYRNVVYLLQLQIMDTKELVFHMNYNESGKFVEELKKTFDCKIISTLHYLDWCFKLSGNLTRFRNHLMSEKSHITEDTNKISEVYREEKEYLEEVDHIICLSENTRQIILNDYMIKSCKISLVYNGLTDSASVSTKSVLRQKYRIPDVPIILFVGRLHDSNNKGLKNALQAFKIVLNTLPHCHFIIVGSGEFDIYLKECEDIWTLVTWTGLIEKEKLYDLYSIADIGVMPSFHEQCSYVAIEMMMHGVPLVAAGTGLCEMVEDRVTGLHIPVSEYEDRAEIDNYLLAEKMLYLLQHPKERQRMGANARKRYETVYSAQIFRQNMIDVYKSLNC